jgi:DNA-binding HxlR family transcriptional regulator
VGFVLGRDYSGQTCSIARTLEVIGERWTMLIVRDIFLGLRRFDDIQADLGIARNVLAARLERLVETGVLEKAPYQEHPLRHEYRLTDKGRDLWPVLVELVQWGDRHAPGPDGPPVVYRHRGCGGALGSGRVCGACGAVVERRGVVVEAGPGAGADHPIHRYVAGAA